MANQYKLPPLFALLLLTLQNAENYIDPDFLKSLRHILNDSLDKSPDEQLDIAIQVINAIQANPKARIILNQNLKATGIDLKRDYTRLFIGLSDNQLIEDRDLLLLVCPSDPSHYRKRVTPGSNINLNCPLHKVPLVPEP